MMETIQVEDTMPYQLVVRKVGNSLMITLPSEITKLVGLHEGSVFDVVVQGDVMTLTSTKAKV